MAAKAKPELEIPDGWLYPRVDPVPHDAPQGTPEWRRVRAGIPTASQFHRIMTPKTLQLSASRFEYRLHLLGERILGGPVETYASPAMQRGGIMEADAYSYYSFATGAEIAPSGFLAHPGGIWGASPDGLVGNDGCVEIKCAEKIATHMAWLFETDSIDADYRTQVQGQLWISNREWVDTIAYHPHLPKTIRRTYRDEAFIRSLAWCVVKFSEELEALVVEASERGYMQVAEELAAKEAEPIETPDAEDSEAWAEIYQKL